MHSTVQEAVITNTSDHLSVSSSISALFHSKVSVHPTYSIVTISSLVTIAYVGCTDRGNQHNKA